MVFRASESCLVRSSKTNTCSRKGFQNISKFQEVAFYTYRGSSESKEPRFQLLEIEANAVKYIRNFSNKPGSGNSGWSVGDRN